MKIKRNKPHNEKSGRAKTMGEKFNVKVGKNLIEIYNISDDAILAAIFEIYLLSNINSRLIFFNLSV